jgi:hypothetical protein
MKNNLLLVSVTISIVEMDDRVQAEVKQTIEYYLDFYNSSVLIIANNHAQELSVYI